MAEGGALTGTIAVEGIAGVLGAFRKIDRGLAAELRGALRGVAELAAQFAVFIAQQKGLRSSGDLIDSIKAGARSSYAYITATATRTSPAFPQGFNYPAIYEYGGSQTRNVRGKEYAIRNRSKIGVGLIAKYGIGTGSRGARAFLYPAAQQGQEPLVHSIEDLLDRLTSEAGLQAGGVL